MNPISIFTFFVICFLLLVLENSETDMDSATDVYDVYTSPIITSTEDALSDINDDTVESSNFNKMDIKNKLFYRKYFYKKLIMS